MVHKTATNVYPTLAEPIAVTSGASGWVLGSQTEIVPANTISTNFSIEHVHVTDISAVDEFEIVLYANGIEIGREFFSMTSGGSPDVEVPIQSQYTNANSSIECAIASSGGGSRTMRVRIVYTKC
jgi:hypothetical protein